MGKQRWLIRIKKRKEESGAETKEQGTKEQTEVVSIEYGTKREASSALLFQIKANIQMLSFAI